jgi:hypothetical protein
MAREVPPALREAHEKLWKELEAEQAAIRSRRARRAEFVRRFDELVGQLRRFAGEVTSADALEWLSTVTAEWQVAFSSILRVPRDLRKEIGVPVPSPNLEYSCRLTESDVHRYLESKAYEIGQERKLTGLFRRWAELRSHRHRIHEAIWSTSEEMLEDWYVASVCFATEVLDGRIHFARQVPRELYPLLEGVWLDDVKRMKAYLIWEKAGMPFEPDGGKADYFSACDDLLRRAMDVNAKASQASFADARTYVEQMYLSEGRVEPARDPSTHDLIARKAHRIWELQSHGDSAPADWQVAQQYVSGFYAHVVHAVLTGSREDIACVANAFCAVHSDSSPHDIANAFEAALVIYYLSAEGLEEVCQQKAGHLM